MIVIRSRGDHAQDFQDGVREIRVPPAGAESDLAENLTGAETQLSESGGFGDEAVEGFLVQRRHQPVPDALDRERVARADGRLQRGEIRPLLQRIRPGRLHRVKDRRQIIPAARVEFLPRQFDHGGGAGRRERIRKRPRL